jgi:lipoprotein signal peptidase
MPVATSPVREKRRTSSSRSTPRKPRKKKRSNLLFTWWPLLLGIAVTPLAIHTASIMALAGPSALMTLYPYVLLVKSPALGLANGLGENLSQLLMYIQFPLYGVLMALLIRSKSLWIALSATATAHFAAVLIVFLMTRTHIQ